MTPGDRPAGLVRELLELLAELDEGDRRSRPRREPTEEISVRSSVSVGGLADAIDNRRLLSPTSPVVTTRSFEGGLCVVADLPGVREEDVSVDLGRAGRSLTVSADGDFVAEVLLDEVFQSVNDVSFNNEVLEVRLLHD